MDFSHRPSVLGGLIMVLLPLCTSLPLRLSHVTSSLNTTTRSSTCPVRLQEDPPASARLITSTLSRAAANDLPQQRIVNGDFISPNLVPYLVSILIPTSEGLGQCTGTLIADDWVITAAHCKPNMDSMFQTTTSSTAGSGVARTPVDIIIHSEYDLMTAQKYDIAVVQLEPNAESDARAMKVNINTEIPESNSYARVMGYGTLGSNIENPSGLLRQVDVPVTSNSKCEGIYEDVNIDSRVQMCAGYAGGGCDSCQGDSGGPLIQYNKAGEPVLVGLVSFGFGCAEAGAPGVYVRTAGFRTWLDNFGVPYEKSSETAPVFRSFSLSRTALGGIVVAGIFLLAVGTILAVYFVRKRNATDNADAATPFTPDAPLASQGSPHPLPPPGVPQIAVPRYQMPGDQGVPLPPGIPQVPIVAYPASTPLSSETNGVPCAAPYQPVVQPLAWSAGYAQPAVPTSPGAYSYPPQQAVSDQMGTATAQAPGAHGGNANGVAVAHSGPGAGMETSAHVPPPYASTGGAFGVVGPSLPPS